MEAAATVSAALAFGIFGLAEADAGGRFLRLRRIDLPYHLDLRYQMG